MKANPPAISILPRLRRRPILAGAAGQLVIMLLASCAAPPAAPPPVSAPPPRVAEPARPVAAAPVDWRDAPLAPGEWVLSINGRQSQARYGALTIACRSDGAVEITVPVGQSAPTVPFTLLTSSRRADLTGQGSAFHAGVASLVLAARDPMLDALAFSRGRFGVEVQGAPPMIVPADPAISRVVEDCRKIGG